MEQKNFAKLKSTLKIPDLLELHKKSYADFLQNSQEEDESVSEDERLARIKGRIKEKREELVKWEKEKAGVVAVAVIEKEVDKIIDAIKEEFRLLEKSKLEVGLNKDGTIKLSRKLREKIKSATNTITKECKSNEIKLPKGYQTEKTKIIEKITADVVKGYKRREYQGLQAAFLDVFGDCNKEDEGVKNSDGSLQIQFLSYEIGEPKYSIEEIRSRDLSYEAPLLATFRIIHRSNGIIKEIKEQPVYLCELPLMTETGSFIINGAERVVVTQIHRSPGVIFVEDEEKPVSQTGKKLFKAAIIPYRGAWLDFEFDLNNVLYVHIDKKRKIPVTTLLRAIGIESTEEIVKLFYDTEVVDKKDIDKALGKILAADAIDMKTGEIICDILQEVREENIPVLKSKVNQIKVIQMDPKVNDDTILLTLRVDPAKGKKDASHHIYKFLRTSDYITSDMAMDYLNALIFKERKYDLTKVGRYKLNKKLGTILAQIAKNSSFKFSVPSERKHVLTPEDIIATIKYLLNLNNGIEGHFIDDIDHLGNRRIRAIGELLENQIRMGLYSCARVTRDKMNTIDRTDISPRAIINTTPLTIIIRKFFGTSQLSQFLDQSNPLAELTHKRRLSALGPGGLHRKRAGFEVRDVHHTHYGRICPIETPEGPNIGLITSMACYARVNQYGLMESPYRKVNNGVVQNEIEYLTADKEDEFIIAQANTPLDDHGKFLQPTIKCRNRGDIKDIEPKKVHYMDISPLQLVSVSAGLIPFLEHDDVNRALMGSNMQRQAVPLIIPEKPLVATGVEKYVATGSCAVISAKQSGEVVFVSSNEIGISNEEKQTDIYHLRKYNRTNQDTCINYIPIIKKGDKIKKGDVIADSFSTHQGQLALGKNLLVAFMSWGGYNFEDAILVSERLIKDDTFTSIHIKEFQVEARDTKLGPEEITRDVPNVGADDLLNLDETGVIRIGAEVEPDSILVGKTSPKGEQQVTMEERLLKAIFGKKAEEVIDTSLRVPPGVKGKVIGVKVFVRKEKNTEKIKKKRIEEIDDKYKELIKEIKVERDNAVEQSVNKLTEDKIEKYYAEKRIELDEKQHKEEEAVEHGEDLPITINKIVKVYIALKRKLQVGDKFAGRHGNKGVISKVLPAEDMPYMPDGTPIDIVLSPLSIPSRMNVGQLLEAMLGWSASVLNIQMVCPVFDSATKSEIEGMIKQAKDHLHKTQGVPERYLPSDDCRITLYDGRTGEPFMEKVTIGNMYVMKLSHLVEDKIHARSTGPYSLITRQPLGGKAQFGGQRIGEMEIWAIEGYGAAHILQEFLTIKSDDVIGRTKIYESIIKGEPLCQPGVPEAFKVLVRELQAVGLNIELLSNKKEPPADEPKDELPKTKKTVKLDDIPAGAGLKVRGI
jgi:DNA-directed RNA polymerase subunit beta